MSDPLHVVNTQALVVRDGRYLMILRSEFEVHAPGVLSPPGGKVEHGDDETGVTVGAIAYVRSRRFKMNRGTPVVDIAFLCQYQSGEAHTADPNEVTGVERLTVEEIEKHPKARWTSTMQTWPATCGPTPARSGQMPMVTTNAPTESTMTLMGTSTISTVGTFSMRTTQYSTPPPMTTMAHT